MGLIWRDAVSVEIPRPIYILSIRAWLDGKMKDFFCIQIFAHQRAESELTQLMTCRKRGGNLSGSCCSRETYESTANSLNFLSSSALSKPGSISEKQAAQLAGGCHRHITQLQDNKFIVPALLHLRKAASGNCLVNPAASCLHPVKTLCSWSQ